MVNLATRSPRRSAVPARRAIRKATTQRDEGPGLTAWHDLGADGARKHRTRLALEGLRERFLPECAFRGRQNSKAAAGACVIFTSSLPTFPQAE